VGGELLPQSVYHGADDEAEVRKLQIGRKRCDSSGTPERLQAKGKGLAKHSPKNHHVRNHV
jgi:hypothetical protein